MYVTWYMGLGNPSYSAISYDHGLVPVVLSLHGGMQISMKSIHGKAITVDVETSDTISLLLSLREGMQAIVKTMTDKESMLHVETSDMIDLREGIIQGFLVTVMLVDGRTLSNYIFQKENFQPMLSLRLGMQIPAKTLNNKTLTLDIQASDVIRALNVKTLHSKTTTLGIDVETSDTMSLLLSLREGMQVIVKTMTDKESIMYAKTSDMIDNVKATVQDVKDIPSFQQYVIFADKQLAGRNVPEVDIQKEPTIHFLPSLREGMQADTIQPKIPDKSIPTIRQRLVFAGKQFKDDHNPSEYDIQQASTLHLVLSLCAGMLDFEDCFSPSIPA